MLLSNASVNLLQDENSEHEEEEEDDDDDDNDNGIEHDIDSTNEEDLGLFLLPLTQ